MYMSGPDAYREEAHAAFRRRTAATAEDPWADPDLECVDLVARPELEPDLGPTPESIEQGAEPDDAYREHPERDAEMAWWPGGWTDGTGVSYRDCVANADLEERFERQREPEPDPEAEIG
jgi:hypothetical protein